LSTISHNNTCSEQGEKTYKKKANIATHHTQKEVLKSNTSGVQGRMDNIYPQMEAAGTKFAVQ